MAITTYVSPPSRSSILGGIQVTHPDVEVTFRTSSRPVASAVRSSANSVTSILPSCSSPLITRKRPHKEARERAGRRRGRVG